MSYLFADPAYVLPLKLYRASFKGIPRKYEWLLFLLNWSVILEACNNPGQHNVLIVSIDDLAAQKKTPII